MKILFEDTKKMPSTVEIELFSVPSNELENPKTETPKSLQEIESEFSGIYTKYNSKIERIISKRLKESKIPDVDSMDICQDVFLGYWKQLQNGKVINTPLAYLKTIASRCIADAYEKRFHFHQLNPDTPRTGMQYDDSEIHSIEEFSIDSELNIEITNSLASEENIETSFENKEFQEICLEVIASLPKKSWQQVVYLNKMEGLSFPEISEKLGLGLEEVKGYGKRGSKVFICEMKRRYNITDEE